jgi:predicted kinase
MTLVIMTGASGSGKTTIAQAVESAELPIRVFCFDSIGVPSAAVMGSEGDSHQPGGAWQRARTFEWIQRIGPIVSGGEHVLFEGQMRIAFIRDALAHSAVEAARIICVDCDDFTRTRRLTCGRLQPELATDNMMGWSRYLRQEALDASCDILDTSNLYLAESVNSVLAVFGEYGVPSY